MTPEEKLEHKRALGRERNRRYLAKKDPAVAARMAASNKAYRERLKNDPAYAERLLERRRRAVERSAAWQKANPERAKANAKAIRHRHPEKEVAKVQRRNAAKLRAIPRWADMGKIARHYANARYLTDVTGHQHHVDHIIPLRGKTVCGLHVENNLRAVPHFLNTRKGNKLVGA
jgi:hypothetical protein